MGESRSFLQHCSREEEEGGCCAVVRELDQDGGRPGLTPHHAMELAQGRAMRITLGQPLSLQVPVGRETEKNHPQPHWGPLEDLQREGLMENSALHLLQEPTCQLSWCFLDAWTSGPLVSGATL